MKRFMSWVVLVVFSYMALFACGFVGGIAYSIVMKILSSKTALVLWIILGGGGGLTVISVIFALLAGVVMSLSESICESQKGVRYKVVAGIIMLIYGFISIGLIVGFVQASQHTLTLVGNILYFYFGLILLLVSFSENRIIWKHD